MEMEKEKNLKVNTREIWNPSIGRCRAKERASTNRHRTPSFRHPPLSGMASHLIDLRVVTFERHAHHASKNTCNLPFSNFLSPLSPTLFVFHVKIVTFEFFKPKHCNLPHSKLRQAFNAILIGFFKW